MVKRVLLVVMVWSFISGCETVSHLYSDLYYTEEGGWRSHRKYKKYETLKDSLPNGIKPYRAYELKREINPQDDVSYDHEESRYYLVFLKNSRAIQFNVESDSAISADDFKVNKGHMAYFEVSEESAILYSYSSMNRGVFVKTRIEKINDSTLRQTIERPKNYFRYQDYVISEKVPEEWLKPIEANW